MDNDLALALQLQEELDRESHVEVIPSTSSRSSTTDLSPVDPSWETLDPNPDIRALFLQFNERFFWGRLAGIEVKWSPRMTLCAGLCVYEGRGGLCSVRLSLPLLKLRPRKDLVETLLHEMIHAYLFVTDNNKDHDGHGPEFHKHMYRINNDIGSNISVYHTFHDEVNEYRQHWWRCNGPCQNRKPFYGYVKRAMNRAPSERDPWWNDHKKTCNGTYIKIKEPENYGKKNKKKDKSDNDKAKPKSEEVKKNMDIRFFVGKGHVLGNSDKPGSSKESNAKNTKSENTHTKPFATGSKDQKLSEISTKNQENSDSGSSFKSDKTLSDKEGHDKHSIQSTSNQSAKGGYSVDDLILLDSDEEWESSVLSQFKEETKKGSVNLNSNNSKTESCNKEDTDKVQAKLREVWANKFSSTSTKGLTSLSRPLPAKNTKAKVTSSCGDSNIPEKFLQPGFSSCAKQNVISVDKNHHSLDTLEPVGHVTLVKSRSLNSSQDKSRSSSKHKLDDDFSPPGPQSEGTKRAKLDSEISEQSIPNICTREQRHPCPVCHKAVDMSLINQHLDQCLTAQS